DGGFMGMASQAATLREELPAILDLLLAGRIVLGRLRERQNIALPIDEPRGDRPWRLIQLQPANELIEHLQFLFAGQVVAFLLLDVITSSFQRAAILILSLRLAIH